MAKAIEGAALLAGAAALFWVVPGVSFALLPYELSLISAMALTGASMEAGAIAGALTSNRGMNITTRSNAAFRQVIYGTQRVGGVTVFESTSGSSLDQFNYVIVLAGHECEAIENLYLDGRQVFWQGSGTGWAVRNGVGFGGIADGANHTGPDGIQYNFGGTGHSGLYCEARYGDQTDPFGTNSPGVATWTGSPTSVIGGLTANDPNWAPDGHGGAPWLGGCCYIYLKIEANSTLFPAPPEIRVTVRGKNNIYDPRTNTTGFTNNWALCCADVLTDSTFGLGDNSVNQTQLIAAANVCDEGVEVAALSTSGTVYESRYCTDWHSDTSTGPGDILSTMMVGAAGRLSRIGGQWFVWPSYWQGPALTVDDNDLTAAPSWKPYRSLRDLFNRVRGTYCAPNFPYSVAGNLYDSNGFYAGMLENNFPFAFQQTNFPEYAADVLHGFASDEYLTEDGGRQLVKELTLQTVLSVTQAQRVAKITLLRNRQQGSGTLTMGLPSYTLQPADTLELTFPEFGWTDKVLEVTSVGFHCEPQSVGESGEKAMAITLEVGVIEADPSVYEWTPTTEELTVYDVPAFPQQLNMTPNPPTSMSLTCSAGTATTDPITGLVTPRIEVQWTTPLDALTTQIQVQYQLETGGTPVGPWIDAGMADVSLNLFYIPAINNQGYNVRIRSVRPSGATSVWVSIADFIASLTLTVATQIALASGTLVGEAYAPITFTGDTTTSSTSVTSVSSTTGLVVGQAVSGAGIPTGTTIATIGSGTITLSAAATATASAVTLTQAGLANIYGSSFSTVVGNITVTVNPTYPIQVLNQGQLYWVYYIDPTLAGGSVTPIATQTQADFLNKAGYYLIDSLIIPTYSSGGGGGGGGRFYPSNFTDTGTRSTSGGNLAYDGNPATFATVSGSYSNDGMGGLTLTDGICTFSGFPAVVLGSSATLTVVTEGGIDSTLTPCEVDVYVGGVYSSTVRSSTSGWSPETYTVTVPSGTDISTVSIVATSQCTLYTFAVSGLTESPWIRIYEIYIQ